jgi:signal peptidase II
MSGAGPRGTPVAGALRWLGLSGVVVVCDRITKALAAEHLVPYESVPIAPLFNLTLMHNTGAAFSLLGDAGGWQRWLFIALAIALSIALIVWLVRLPRADRMLAAALALIIGGALGNLWDRLAFGYVVDFIDIYYGRWHWPAFNVADSAITVGAVLFIADSLWQPMDDRADV